MGEAKTKRELKEQRRAARRAAAEYSKTIPMRAIKALLGAILAPFILAFVIAADCFQDNKWPWRKL